MMCQNPRMVRPLRIEFAGAMYHITSRGDRREAIVEDDEDRREFVTLLGDVTEQMGWHCYAWCLMDNHYHLVLETPDANLSRGMRQLNGMFTQSSNRRHGRSGHLFQGRYKAILVDREPYLLELCRYVVLNPVRASVVDDPALWLWSSYRATIGLEQAPAWLAHQATLSHFGGNLVTAQKLYAQFVAEGMGSKSIWRHLNRQIYLGNDVFVQHAQANLSEFAPDENIPGIQIRPPAPSLSTIEQTCPSRNEAIAAAYATGEYSYADIGKHFHLHFTTVGEIVRKQQRIH